MVFVSHDRYFIDKLATRVLEVGDGRVEVYPGNYEDYRWRKEGGAAALQKAVTSPANSQPANGNSNGQPAKSEDAAAKRLNPIKRKQMEDRVRELELEINRLEDTIAECEAALQSFVSAEETQRVTQELQRQKGRTAKAAGGVGTTRPGASSVGASVARARLTQHGARLRYDSHPAAGLVLP